jgi:hypothetical protein
MNGCVTKEGITADLESMKRVGLGGAQLFSVHLTAEALFSVQAAKYSRQYREVRGEVTFMSPQWRELVRHAVSESHRLGLELSILHSEGWGQGGGSWVEPAQSMQKLVWSEAPIQGGRRVSLNVRRPVPEPAYYRDIALLAFPTPPGDLSSHTPKISVSARLAASETRSPYAEAPLFTMPLPTPNRPQWLQLDFGQPCTASSLYIDINDMRDNTDPDRWVDAPYLDPAGKKALGELRGPHYWELQASDDGTEFRGIGRVSTHGTSSFPQTKARFFRIWMPVPPPLQKPLPIAASEPMEITSVALSGPRIDRAETRAGKYIDSQIKEFSNTTVPPENVTSAAGVVDLTGRTDWDAPAGEWILLRIGHASTGATIANGGVGGLEADKLSREAVMQHLTRGMLGAVLDDVGTQAGTTLNNVLCDSWERGYANWTPAFPAEFKKRRGYAVDPWLPALTGRVVDSTEVSERFLWDFRRTLGDLLADNYYGVLQAYAGERNLGVYAEATGHVLPGLADQLLCKGRVDVPMGEFWSGRRDVDDAKEAASAAHIYGKRLAAAEAFTARTDSASWTRDPFMLKGEGDLRFCMGINRLCFHRFAHQPWPDRQPGMTMGKWGTELERTNTWWDMAGPWVEYLTRCQFLLQRGTFVADLCYFYGEDVPMDFRFPRLKPALPKGYDFDVCNAEVLLNRMSVRNGRITLPDGPSYRVLILPDNDRMTLRVLRALQKLVLAGATVAGPKPLRSPSLEGYPKCDRELKALADELWGDSNGTTVTEHRYGAGRVLWGGDLVAALGAPPDFTSDDPRVNFIHRRDGDDIEIYFVSNESKKETLAACKFRVTGLIPELWYPDSGQRMRPAHFASAGGHVSLPIHLDPAGSVFVIFRAPEHPVDPVAAITGPAGVDDVASARAFDASLAYWKDGTLQMPVSQAGRYMVRLQSGKAAEASAEALPSPLELTGSWDLRFPPDLGAPSSARFERLASWTESKEDGIRYFSGTATYQKTFDLTAAQKQSGVQLFLDLGAVKNLCEVSLNGQNLGILWKPPFRLDLTSAARTGTNQLEVRVTNLWPNRLIGDVRNPGGKQITWTTFNPYEPDAPLLESGLLGPVKITASRVISFAP